MSTKYKTTELGKGYFITITTFGWIDVFTRLSQKNLVINALSYCQKNKGLEIYAYCIMSSHVHIICKAPDGIYLSNIIRDFKKYTSKKIVKTIIEYPESRREWMLALFKQACNHVKRKQNYKVWQDGYHAEVLYSNSFIKEKLNYIHNNPVKEKIVSNAEDFVFSSARNYADLDFELKVTLLHLILVNTDCKSTLSGLC